MTLEGEIVLIEALVKQAFSAATVPARPLRERAQLLWEEAVSFYLNGGEK